MAKTSPFLFPSTFPSDPSESSSSSSPSSSPSFRSSRSNSSFSFNSPYKSLSSLSPPPLSHTSSSHFPPAAGLGPCAACKFHGRRCSESCYLASFFPLNDAHKFAVVDSVFGSGDVVSFLQQNSNSSFIPLLLLLRDTSREDGELHSDSKNNTEINIHKQQLDDSTNSNHVGDLIQGRELMEESKLQNDVAPTVTATNDPNQSPVYMDCDPGIVNFNAVHSQAARKRKAVLTWTKHVRVSPVSGLEEHDDGHSWKKYGQKDVCAKYPRSYYRCTYRYSQNCLATKQMQRSDGDPYTFEITYRGAHTCSEEVKPQPQLQQQASSEEQEEQNIQYQLPQEAPFNFQPSTNSIEIFPMPYVSDSTVRDNWQDSNEVLGAKHPSDFEAEAVEPLAILNPTSTKRVPSKFEQSTGRGRVRTTSGRGANVTSSGKPNILDTYIHNYIVAIILPFVQDYLDVLGDGNCGFRVVADFIFGDESRYVGVRDILAKELVARDFIYHNICVDGVDTAVDRILCQGGPCDQNHWMTVAEDLFVIATCFNAAVFHFGFGQNGESLYSCMTVLPLRASSMETRPEREIVIAHLGSRCEHFIRLDLSPNFPVPPIVTLWYEYRDESVAGWDNLYRARRLHWDSLVEL